MGEITASWPGIEDEHQAGDGSRRADEHQRRGPPTGADPVVADQDDRRRVLQQQSDPHREVLHRAEVAELCAGHRDHAVGDQAVRPDVGWAGRSVAAGAGRARAGPGTRRRSGPRPPPPETSRWTATPCPAIRTARTRPRSRARSAGRCGARGRTFDGSGCVCRPLGCPAPASVSCVLVSGHAHHLVRVIVHHSAQNAPTLVTLSSRSVRSQDGFCP